MFKRLLLLSCTTLLVYRSHAQSAPLMEVKLPGEVPGAAASGPAGSAARLTTVSQPQEVLIQNWTTAAAWADYTRQVYLRYLTPTLPGTIRTDRKSGTNWVLYGAHRYRYTTAGEIQSDSIDQYQQTPYGPYYASIYTFNTPSQVRWEWQKYKLSSPTVWDSVKRNSHSYNAAGQRTQVLEEFYNGGGSFSTVARRLWTYNALGQISVYEGQSSSGNSWSPLQRFTYTYNAAGKIQQAITETVLTSGNAYGNSARNTYTFDAQGRESVLTTESWGNGVWVPSSQTLYAYTTTGDLTTATLQAWNSSTSAYQNYQRALFTYAQVTSTRSQAASIGLTIAPNPGTEAVLHYQLPTSAAATVEVFDLTGRRVAVAQPAQNQLAGAHAVSLAGLALAPGLYSVHLRAGAQQWQVKWDKR